MLQVEVLKGFSREQLVSWFLDHRGNCSRKLSVHVSAAMMVLVLKDTWF